MDDSQLEVPASFSQVYATPDGRRLTVTLSELRARYELCEDMAQMLTERASEILFKLGVAESDVLERMQGGLAGEGSPVTPAEARWVTCRLAELLGWPMPDEPSGEALPHSAQLRSPKG